MVYTIGYGGRHPDEFLGLLAENGIKAVVDVRLRPDRASVGCYSLAKTPDKGIQKLLAGKNVAYFSFIQLGNVFLGYEDWRERYRRFFVAAGEILTEPLFSTSIPEPWCLMCSEKRAAECHRSVIADFLAGKGYEVRNIESSYGACLRLGRQGPDHGEAGLRFTLRWGSPSRLIFSI